MKAMASTQPALFWSSNDVADENGNVNEAHGEACDDGNQVDSDACRNDCTAARCGDGVAHDMNCNKVACPCGRCWCYICEATLP